MIEGLVDHIAAAVDFISVVTRAAAHGVVARTAGQHIGAAVADEDVVQTVAGGVDAIGTAESEIIEIRGQRVTHLAGDGVDATRRRFGDLIERVVDHIAVVAVATAHKVGASAAVQDIGAAVAKQDIALAVAGGIDIGATEQSEIFNIAAEREADGGAHQVGTSVRGFGNHIEQRVDEVDVVADAAVQIVIAATAIKQVVATATDEGIVAGQAVQLVVAGGAEQVEIVVFGADDACHIIFFPHGADPARFDGSVDS